MKRFFYKYLLPYLGLVLARLLYITYRIQIVNKHIEQRIYEKGERPVYISWHQRFFTGIFFLSKKKPIAIIVSQSKDGDLISGIIERAGWLPVRGSSSKGGVKALKQIKDLADSGYSMGHIVDGPRGPFGEVKPGLLVLSKISGMPILPVIISAEKKWVFKSWDRFTVPKPFSRVMLRFEEEIYISGKSGKDELEALRKDLEDKLFRYYEQADKYWE